MVIMEDFESDNSQQIPPNRAQACIRVLLWILPSATCASLKVLASCLRGELGPFSLGRSSGSWWVAKLKWVVEMKGDHLLLIGFILAIAAGWCDTRLRVRADSDWGGTLQRMIVFVVFQPVIAFLVFMSFLCLLSIFVLMAEGYPRP